MTALHSLALRLSAHLTALTVIVGGFASASAFADNYTGVISKVNTKIYLLSSNGAPGPLEVKPLTADVQKNLVRLESGDYMAASGSIINGAMVIQSIDFVALAELLGIWKNGTDWINFKDFSHAVVFLAKEPSFNGKATLLQYSMVPGGNNSWKIFFSTEDNVISATLVIHGEVAEFTFFDQGSENSQVYQLTKLSFAYDNHPKARR